jgi:hypothetical protein
MQKELNEFEIIERYMILILGVVDRSIPSREHLQKELFILSKAYPKASGFLKFKKHHKGPFSSEISELIDKPAYYVNAFSVDKRGRCSLTEKGKEIYEQIVKENSEDPQFKELLAAMKLIRELYDKLSKDELLFLMYVTFPEFRKRSIYFDKLLAKKKKLAKSLLKKGLITEKRFKELASYNYNSKQ